MPMRRLWVVVGLVGSFAGATAARAQEATTACVPACSAGQTCIEGVCMVPAAPAPATPPPTAAPAPTGYPYAPPPTYAPPPPPRRPPRTGTLVLPYVGFNSMDGEGTDPDVGLRLGTILGGRVNELFSANGELAFDQVNVDAPAGLDIWEYIIQLTFSPLFHFTSPGVEFVLGPKLGVWAMFGHLSGGGNSADVSARGWTVGVNAGVFFPVNAQTSLGLLLSYVSLQPTQVCIDVSGYYGGEQCQDGDNDLRVLGMNFAVLF